MKPGAGSVRNRPFLLSSADSGKALPCTRACAAGAPRRRGRLCGGHSSPEGPPMRRAPLRGARQRALPSGLPLGHSPRPRDALHLCFACGRDGGSGAVWIVIAVLTGPPKGQRAGRLTLGKEKNRAVSGGRQSYFDAGSYISADSLGYILLGQPRFDKRDE